jgi:S1-C subfamily serine protease
MLVEIFLISVVIIISDVALLQAAELFSGSGVAIGAHGEVLTNAHVIANCTQITIRNSQGQSAFAGVTARDQKNDLAVVQSTLTSSAVASFKEGGPIRAGDTIVALGYPLAGVLATEANISVGNVSALAGLADDSRYVQVSAPVQPGNSGGPLLDASGHLVGIVTAKLDAVRVARFTGDIPQNVNFALKAEVARAFLDSKRIAYRTAPSDKQLSPADIGDVARPFTVRIECRQAAIVAPIEPSPPVSQSSQRPLPNNTRSTRAAPCGNFQKLSDGNWAVTKQIKINHGNASVVLNRGTIFAPRTEVAGADIYAALEKGCQ